MQIIASTTQAYPRDCLGCMANKRDVMLDIDPHKHFGAQILLTTEQAQHLILRIQAALKANEEGGE